METFTPDSIQRIFQSCITEQATDVLLFTGFPPMIRLQYGFTYLQTPNLGEAEIRSILGNVTPRERWDELAAKGRTTFDHFYLDRHCFRVDIFDTRPSLMVALSLLKPPIEVAQAS